MDDASPTAPLVSVVIPLYNEGSHVRELLSDLKEALQETGCRFEVVLVDDGSPDDTWERIKDEARTLPNLRAVRLSRNFGKELALCAGLERARGDAMVVMDGWTTPAFALAGNDREVAELWNRHCAGCESQTGARIFSQKARCVVLL